MSATLEVDILKIEHNCRVIAEVCYLNGVNVLGVTKGICGNSYIAKTMLKSGLIGLADSRLLNIKRLRKAGLRTSLFLLRSPSPTDVSDVVQWADGSMNSELEIVKMLSKAAMKAKKIHRVVLMVDMGEGREGILPFYVPKVAGDIQKLKGVILEGLGTNFTCISDLSPTYRQLAEFKLIAKDISEKLGSPLKVVSGGGSSVLPYVVKGQLPIGINQLRVGETILLGREVPTGRSMPELYQNTFILRAEIIEVKARTGKYRSRKLKNNRNYAIANIGLQDIEIKGIMPVNKKIKVVAGSSDHIVLDITDVLGCNVGTTVSFLLDYYSLIRAMTSPYIDKYIIGAENASMPLNNYREGLMGT